MSTDEKPGTQSQAASGTLRNAARGSGGRIRVGSAHSRVSPGRGTLRTLRPGWRPGTGEGVGLPNFPPLPPFPRLPPLPSHIMLLSLKQEGCSGPRYRTDEPGGHGADSSEPGPWDSSWTRSLERQITETRAGGGCGAGAARVSV